MKILNYNQEAIVLPARIENLIPGLQLIFPSFLYWKLKLIYTFRVPPNTVPNATSSPPTNKRGCCNNGRFSDISLG